MSAIERSSANLIKYSFNGSNSSNMRFVVVDYLLIIRDEAPRYQSSFETDLVA